MRTPIKCLASALLFTFSAPASAEVTPHPLFSDGAVLQRDKPVTVWGTADDGEKVTVAVQEQEATATAEKGGKWQVTLKPLKTGGPVTMTIRGDRSKAPIEIKDVLVGEVWVCSGQSNMGMALRGAADAQETIAASDDSQLRLFTVPRKSASAEQTDLTSNDFPLKRGRDTWKHAGPETVPGFSAVAYYFGRDLRKALGVPIGLIHSSVGGTPAESWTPRASLEAEPALASIIEAGDRTIAAYPKALERYKAEIEARKAAFAAAKAKGERPPAAPRAPDPNGHVSNLYNGMIAPIIPYRIAGAIWYQGEANAGRAGEYQTLLSALIKGWRGAWGEGDFPFLVVQLAPFMKIVSEPGESTWAALREAQYKTTHTVPNTALAVITDVGEENDIHPKRKAPVGARLALAARALAYGEKIESSGPEQSGAEFKDGKAVISFSHLGGGLIARDGPLKGFAIAGEDRTFVNARATIEGDTVVVQSDSVPKPVAVRYGWADYPLGNLWNRSGLPASPFRTDDFPLASPRRAAPPRPARAATPRQ